MNARVAELRTKLREVLDENEGMATQFKVGTDETGRSDGVVVSAEQRDRFRQNLAKAREIKALIDDETAHAELKSFEGGLDDLERKQAQDAANGNVPTAAMIAAAQAAGAGNGLWTPGNGVGLKSIAELFTESPEFKELKEGGGYTMRNDFRIEGVDLGGMWVGLAPEMKDVYTAAGGTTTTLGFGRFQRDPLIPRPFRRVRVRDLFPVVTTDANLIDYFRVSGFTNAASAVPERSAGAFALKPQSALSFTTAQAPVRTLAHFEVAHRNVLQDEPQLQGIINNELLYGLRLHEDYQILQGTGTSEDLLGILNTPGVQVYNHGSGPATDNKADVIRRGMTRAILAYYEPTGTVVHPYDWEDIELTKDANDNYVIAASVALGAQQTLWRSPLVDTPAMPEGQYLTGAFGLGAQLYDRQIANIRIAEQHADFFIRNAIVVLAEQRLALAVKRPESFVKGTLE